MLRSVYDRAVAPMLERSERDRDLATAGPVAVEETWDRLGSDCVRHVVLWVNERPRSQVFPGFLSPILLSSGMQQTFTWLYDPVRADQAARDIRKNNTAKHHGGIQQEADRIAGHGALRDAGLIAISAPTTGELEAPVAAVEQTAIQASCETTASASAPKRLPPPLCRSVAIANPAGAAVACLAGMSHGSVTDADL
jgi:hypothetical protein